MKKDSSAFSTIFALFILFSLFIIVLAVSFLVGTSIKKVNRIEENYRKYNEVNIVIQNVLSDMQVLKDCEKDFLYCVQIDEIKKRYAKYELEIIDVSTGINEKFLSGKIKEELKIKEISEVNGIEIISSYGWINKKYADEQFLNDLYKEHGTEELFPLICRFPLNNVNFMKKEHIETVLSYFKIPDSKNKLNKIMNKQNYGITDEELIEILKCQKESEIFDFLGTKTSFWKLSMRIGEADVMAVIAAIPEIENQRKIDKYILIEKKYETGYINR